jgi:tRNA threonylcarbamoyladenosine biosynthesis protein TsaB
VSTRILAIDTTSKSGSVALAEDGSLVRELPMESNEGYSPILFGHIQSLLEQTGWNLGSINCFASAAGPGSFTGVRVGLAAVKGLAEATGKPIVAVSNLEAIAVLGREELRAPLIDAKRGEIYAALYDSSLQVVCEPTVTHLERWLTTLPPGVEFLTTGFDPPVTPLRIVGPALAGAIAQIAYHRLMAARVDDAAAVDAHYVRRSDAELYWKD